MLRTIFSVGLLVVVGSIAFKLLAPLFLGLLGLAIKVLVVGAVAYGVIRLVSPSTARRLHDRANSGKSY
jgi:hypothetical protein